MDAVLVVGALATLFMVGVVWPRTAIWTAHGVVFAAMLLVA
jgi:hypothetical protein